LTKRDVIDTSAIVAIALDEPEQSTKQQAMVYGV